MLEDNNVLLQRAYDYPHFTDGVQRAEQVAEGHLASSGLCNPAVGRKTAPQSDPYRNPRTCGYATVHGKRALEM